MINVNIIITIIISTCIIKERAIKQGTLNKVFFYKLIKGLKDHRYIKDKCKISLQRLIAIARSGTFLTANNR